MVVNMEKKRKNIVWFCTDQQRWDTIHSLGNPYIHTPNIDRLVKEGVAFIRAYTQAPICTPSRACFLTGRYPRTTKTIFNGNEEFSKDEKLVTKLLADEGYTCGLAGKLHLTSAEGRVEKRCDDGYSYFQYSHHPHNDWKDGGNDYQNWLNEKGVHWEEIYGGKFMTMATWPPQANPAFSGKQVGVPAQYHQTTWCVEKTIDFIESRRNTGEPWLISVNPFDPHPPLDPPQEYKDRLSIEDMPLPLWEDGEMEGKPPHQQKDVIQGGQDGQAEPIGSLTDEEKREHFRDYYAEIELIDDQFGRLLAYLERTGLRDDTIVIFMSDHGEMSGDHGLYWKGAYFYEGLVHVPLIISCPSVFKQGLQCDALVELVDIAPTLMDAAGLEVPYFMQGKSFYGILTGEADPHHFKDAVYSEFYHCLRGTHEDIDATMYYNGRYKLVIYHGKEFGELYDHETDPNEFHNLWDKPEYETFKTELVRKSFDHTVLCNMDNSMHRVYGF